jgi:thiol-disulfide isomerase/thioredoxin
MSRLPHPSLGILIAVSVALLASAAGAQPLAPAGSPPASPSKGDVVPVFETLGIDGKAVKVDFPRGSKTVLVFFLSGCPSCHKMIPEWNRAYERRAKDLRILGVIMDQEPPGFWSSLAIAFPVLRAPGQQFLRSLNINRAPLTLRVAEGGKIEDLALGVVDPIRLGELFAPPRPSPR